ncbi:hypothetical protein ACFY4C_21045 [Actinomadura viridis]|uniref:hypothetical protein n=1 Tax=Actinomadura viridis TaxID=58110 RepID=UPI0036B34C2E
MAKKKSKKHVSTPEIKTKEVPRRSALPGAETSDERICWRFCHVDHEGPWGFGHVDGETLCWLMGRLGQFETMKINEIFSNSDYPGKHYEVESIPTTEALGRLTELQLGDMTKISCLRLQGEPRLYGFLLGNVFHVVWWDPKHEVWPSKLKHT